MSPLDSCRAGWREYCTGSRPVPRQSLPLPWCWQERAPNPQPCWFSSVFSFELPPLCPTCQFRVGFYKSCCAEGSRRGVGGQASVSSSLVLARTSPSTPQPVPSMGSVNGTQWSEPRFQSKQTGVGSHPRNSQHCRGGPFWKKCEIYCNTCWGSYGGSELLNPLNLSLQLHWQGLSLCSAPSLWFHCSNIFPYMEAFLPQPGLILTCHCIWMLAHFSQLTLCKGRCLNLLLFK